MTDKKKYRGSGTHGGGSKKKRRGAGSHGGRGRDGEKHRKFKYIKEGDEERGFKRPENVIDKKRTINLSKLDMRVEELLEKDVAEETDDGIEIDISEIGYDKLLGSGKVTRKLNVKAKEFSEKAKQKLEEAGGSAIELP
ncbi:MAG: uL15m family ribosomal protein [Candidatus Aenigmatarchaeota archaeon]